ncbi:unnamed protein product [Caenorhabditis auriculariae]|uniref:Glycosyltransferase family 92 protein n=1 Tax=Caenorhabditis auriculariae TaxID=2777116 RepID=A0A8S1HXQ5_9PELO|nr:unnamed protein product [Caenorhabditis auriculariae]
MLRLANFYLIFLLPEVYSRNNATYNVCDFFPKPFSHPNVTFVFPEIFNDTRMNRAFRCMLKSERIVKNVYQKDGCFPSPSPSISQVTRMVIVTEDEVNPNECFFKSIIADENIRRRTVIWTMRASDRVYHPHGDYKTLQEVLMINITLPKSHIEGYIEVLLQSLDFVDLWENPLNSFEPIDPPLFDDLPFVDPAGVSSAIVLFLWLALLLVMLNYILQCAADADFQFRNVD